MKAMNERFDSKMGKTTPKVPDSFIIALFVHVYIGWGLLYLVKLATVHLTHNAYWGIFIALFMIIPFYWMVYQLAKYHPGLSISQIFSQVFGRAVGALLVVAFLLHIFYFQIIFFRDSQMMVYTYFFNRFPFSIMTALLIAGVLYVALHGVESVGRLGLFMLIPPFLAIFLLQVIGLVNVNPLNLQPIFEGTFRQWLLAGSDVILVLLPGTGVVILFPFFRGPETMKKFTFYSLAMVVPLFFLNILGIVGTFGSLVMNKMNWPIVEYFHVIDFPFLLLEQMGLFFLIAWYASIFVTLSVGAFCVGNEFHILFPKIKCKWFIVTYGIVLWIIVNLPIGILTSERFFRATQKGFAFSFLGFLTAAWLVNRLHMNKTF
jgi:spore germination protein (amino acid permease)